MLTCNLKMESAAEILLRIILLSGIHSVIGRAITLSTQMGLIKHLMGKAATLEDVSANICLQDIRGKTVQVAGANWHGIL